MLIFKLIIKLGMKNVWYLMSKSLKHNMFNKRQYYFMFQPQQL